MYRLTDDPSCVVRLVDGVCIPEGHRWWDEYQSWLASGNTPEQHPHSSAAEILSALTQTLDDHLDSVAAERSYDNRFTCALRAGFIGPFQAEGLAFAEFMDKCNMKGYSIMLEVKAGLRPVPTGEELIAELPPMVWPPSPIPVDIDSTN